MQTDREALLAGILADPDADLPRLVFADWLEETGHPANCARAEYIRLAIEHVVFRPRGPTLRNHMRRLAALRGMFADEWDILLATNAGLQGVKVEPKRGFVDRLTTPVDLLIDLLGELYTSLPVRHLTLTWPPHFRSELGATATRRLHMTSEPKLDKGLRFSTLTFNAIPAPESILSVLLQGCDVTRLKQLSLPGCTLYDDALVGVLAEAKPHLAASGLVALDLSGNPLTDHAAHTLAATDWPPGFRRLVIDGTRITNAGREVLFRRFGFEELRPRLALS